jgi:hypothetical protein
VAALIQINAGGQHHAHAPLMMSRGLIGRQAATRYALTEQGRAVLAAMLERR